MKQQSQWVCICISLFNKFWCP